MRQQSDPSRLLLPEEGKRVASLGRAAVIAGAIPILLLILSILAVILLAGSASGGTETGEFCPTCPDWTNLDGWLEKKAAYEEDMKNGLQNGQQNELNKNESKMLSNSSNNRNSSKIISSSNLDDGSSNGTTSVPRRSVELRGAVASPDLISPDEIILDISPSAPAYIEGAVNLNYDNFFSEGGEIVPVAEMARLLGDAGISNNDSLLITGECLPCGGGPSPAFFTYWALKYLGHEKVRVLEGAIDDWKAAGLNISNRSAIRPRTEYIPHIRPELLATYEYVATSGAQIVDARPANAYDLGSIPGAINIPYQRVLNNDSIKPAEELEGLFHDLDRNRSVVVYTNTGVEAALVWFALNDSGYDARLYTWRDWLENQPKFPYELTEVSAQPNPVRSGESTTISALFQRRKPEEKTNMSSISSSPNGSSANQEAKLTVKGCVTCGFGSPQSFANLDRKDGYVQIGSAGKAAQNSATSNASAQSSAIDSEISDGTLRCSAVIETSDSTEVARTSLLETSGGRYMGVWNASVAPGIYKVSIVATLDGNAEAFLDVLMVEVKGRG